MAKVKQDGGPATAAPTAEKAPAEPKKPGRNDLVAEFTMQGKATFHFDDPQMETGEFVSYNGGKGTHAYRVVRDQDNFKGKSGRTALKYLMHASGKSLLDIVTEQSKRGRPAKQAEGATATPPAANAAPAPAPAAQPEPAKEGGKPNDPFSFMDDKK